MVESGSVLHFRGKNEVASGARGADQKTIPGIFFAKVQTGIAGVKLIDFIHSGRNDSNS